MSNTKLTKIIKDIYGNDIRKTPHLIYEKKYQNEIKKLYKNEQYVKLLSEVTKEDLMFFLDNEEGITGRSKKKILPHMKDFTYVEKMLTNIKPDTTTTQLKLLDLIKRSKSIANLTKKLPTTNRLFNDYSYLHHLCFNMKDKNEVVYAYLNILTDTEKKEILNRKVGPENMKGTILSQMAEPHKVKHLVKMVEMGGDVNQVIDGKDLFDEYLSFPNEKDSYTTSDLDLFVEKLNFSPVQNKKGDKRIIGFIKRNFNFFKIYTYTKHFKLNLFKIMSANNMDVLDTFGNYHYNPKGQIKDVAEYYTKIRLKKKDKEEKRELCKKTASNVKDPKIAGMFLYYCKKFIGA